MIVKLPYASEAVAVDLRGIRVRPLAPRAPSDRRDVREMVGNAIDQPVSGASLGDRAMGRTSATIIVPDTTRKLPLREILPVILQNLVGAGIRDSKITILIACGTHPGVGAGETRALIGELPAGISVVEHDSRSANELVTVGELRPGIPLRLNRAAIETDLLITVGAIRHHYFAGFGGGPKMVFPGVAGHDEIQANHSLVLATGDDGSRIRDPRCEPGILDGNPVAEEIARAADIRPPDMAICLLEGGDGTPAWVGAGPWRASFDAAVARARSWFEIDGAGPFDFMVASGGGAPTDSTLIQAHKGLDAACRFLAPGGRLLYVAAIDRGAGSEAMLPFLQDPDPETILARLAETWVQYGHTTLRLLEKTSRFEVALHSRLEPDVARRLGFEPVLAVQDVINAWREESPGATIGVMASGAVYPCP